MFSGYGTKRPPGHAEQCQHIGLEQTLLLVVIAVDCAPFVSLTFSSSLLTILCCLGLAFHFFQDVAFGSWVGRG